MVLKAEMQKRDIQIEEIKKEVRISKREAEVVARSYGQLQNHTMLIYGPTAMVNYGTMLCEFMALCCCWHSPVPLCFSG